MKNKENDYIIKQRTISEIHKELRDLIEETIVYSRKIHLSDEDYKKWQLSLVRMEQLNDEIEQLMKAKK